MGLDELLGHLVKNATLRTVMDNLQEAVVLTDRVGGILYTNQKYKETFGIGENRNVFTNSGFEASEQKAGLLELAINTGINQISSRVKFTKTNGSNQYFNAKIVPFENRNGALISFVDVTKEIQESMFDGLTGAYSQSYYVRSLKDQAISEARRTNGYLGVIGIDLKGLKQINDTVSHQAGSHLLSKTGSILRESVRKVDYVIRDGGDEFTLLCPSADQKAIDGVIKRIRDKLLFYNQSLEDQRMSINLYMVGLADNKDYSTLFEMIDQKITQQKGSSR